MLSGSPKEPKGGATIQFFERHHPFGPGDRVSITYRVQPEEMAEIERVVEVLKRARESRQ